MSSHCSGMNWLGSFVEKSSLFWKDLNTFELYRGESNDHGIHSNYRYKFAFPFENVPDPKKITLFLQNNWQHTITISVVYFVLIKLIQGWMKNRAAFSLKLPLFLWNFALALFSIAGLIRFGEDLIQSLIHRTLYETICYSCHPNDVAAYWSLLFAISKIVELGDTLFIVLRKKPLIFLHYYHHAAVLIYTVHAGAEHTAAGRAFITMNYLAHSCMYTYYAISALGIRVSRSISKSVTIVQTTQMLAGVAVSFTVLYIKTKMALPCQQSMSNLYLAFLIYTTFLVLFLQFYWKAYLSSPTTKRVADRQKKNK